MTRRRGLLVGVVGAAAVLLVGRLFAVVIAERWYAEALGVGNALAARVRLDAALRLLTAGSTFVLALANLLAVRQSIVSLALPRQVGDLAIAEAVPGAILTAGAVALAGLLALGAACLAPATLATQLALDGVTFGVSDPYLFRDVGFYVAWLPFERWLFETAAALLALVSAVTVCLYAATPSIRLEGGRWRVAGWVRRHLAVLAGAGLLLLAWAWRLAAFDVVGAADAVFGAVTHRVRLPYARLAPYAALVGAVLVGRWLWSGRWRAALGLAGALVLAVPLGREVLVAVGSRQGTLARRAEWDAPYARTRAAFAGWALDSSARWAAAMGVAAEDDAPPGDPSSAGEDGPLESARFAPAAGRYAVVDDPTGTVRAPALSGAWRRLWLAWSLRTPGLLRAGWGLASPRLVTRRDPVERLASVYPFLTPVGPARLAPGPMGPRWTVDLFIVADRAPISSAVSLGGRSIRYARRVAIGTVDASTGAVGLILQGEPDPVLRAWMAVAPDLFRPGLVILPDERSGDSGAGGADAGADAGTNRALALVRAAYDSASAAARRGDLRTFEGAWWRMGRLLGLRGP